MSEQDTQGQDGTPESSENNNQENVEELKETINEQKQAIKRLREDKESTEEEKSNAVEELKGLRKRLRKLEDDGEGTSDSDSSPSDVESIVEKKLQEEKKKEAKTNKEKAFNKFVQKNKEFHPDNDETGIKQDALERELSNFKEDGLYSVEDYMNLFRKAKRLVQNDSSDNSEDIKPNASTPTNSGSPKKKDTSGDLSKREQEALEQSNISKERFLELKESNPQFIRNLLNS